MSKLHILTRSRRKTFNGVPALNANETVCYMDIDSDARKSLRAFRTVENQLGFLIQQAYFRAKGRFFDKRFYLDKDIRKAKKQLGIKGKIDLDLLSTKTIAKQRAMILKSYGWISYDASAREEITLFAALLVDKQMHGEDILFSLLAFCWKHRIEIPDYEEFLDIISQGYRDYESKVELKMASLLTSVQSESLHELLSSPPCGIKFGNLKRINQEITQSALKTNAILLGSFKDVYFKSKPLLEELNLTDEATKYFSSTVANSGASAIKKFRSMPKRCLYLACFVKDQFYQRQDYAVDAIIKTVKSGLSAARGVEKAFNERAMDERLKEYGKASDAAKTAIAIIKQIDEITRNDSISNSQRVEQISQLTQAFMVAEVGGLIDFAPSSDLNTTGILNNAQFYATVFHRQSSWQKSLGPLVKSIEFDESRSDKKLIEAIEFYKSASVTINEKTPFGHLSATEKELILEPGDVPNISRYKAMLFVAIERGIKNRTLTLEHSYRYRHTRSYFIAKHLWEANKAEYIAAAGLQKYENVTALLKEIGSKLTLQYEELDHKITNKLCSDILLRRDGSWRIEKQEASFDSSRFIPELLRHEKTKSLVQVLSVAEQFIPTLSDCFRHQSIRNRKPEIDKQLLFASIISLGTNLGHTNMSKASQDVTSKQLRDTEKLWLSNENLTKANTEVVKAIQALPLPTVYAESSGKVHSSSDGQKVVVAVNSLLANFSYKYYGKEQGVSINSFVDDKQSFYHVNVLSSSDREAAFMMDGLVASKNNSFKESDLEHIHSTDTHGYTEAIFSGLHFLDVSFAPRIKNVHKQTLYGYENKSNKKKSGFAIAPNQAINKKLIINHWDEILHLMASIKLGHCSAALIFRILSSSKSSNLYRALKEFGRLLKSSYIVNYISDATLKKTVQKQLNRVELGQRMSKAIFFGRSGNLMVGEEDEIQKAVLCMTLLKNVIILWNYYYLSNLLCQSANEEEKRQYIESISGGSVIAWAHINMHGTYVFKSRSKDKPFKSSLRQMKNLTI